MSTASASPGTGLELHRLAEVGELVEVIESGQVSLVEATEHLDEIDKIPHPWGNLANAASYAFAGVGFAVLLSGGWCDDEPGGGCRSQRRVPDVRPMGVDRARVR